MEKCVRLFESFGAPKHAASCALEGMPEAPNREKHESMRAAAFSRFIDAGELEAALTAILSDPFMGGETISVKVLESESLRDAVSLLVNATADDGKLQWLVEQELPGPLKVMCGHALERRARATENFPITEMTMRAAIDPSMLLDQDMDHMDDFDVASDYELVYSWHVFHGDDASAATTALEWAGRVSNEGLLSIRNAISGPSRAYHPDEVKASEGKLIIDVKYYLESQIFPPILRLCDQIDGIEASRVAVSLGLDGRRFEKRDDQLDGYNDYSALGPHSAAEKFSDVDPLMIACASCGVETEFLVAQFKSSGDVKSSGLQCAKCRMRFPSYQLHNISLRSREWVRKYYTCELVIHPEDGSGKEET
ncbi:DNA polymerase alpha catalytic subunit [Gracilaria domingensis]|nr:DNA polymerase alpha catalytic subunit [Gracilaria domingensis]